MEDKKDSKVRLHKHLADLGLTSRRKAEAWIQEGKVRVNGKVAEVGCKIDPSVDTISITGMRVPVAKKKRIVLAMNKPRGVICSHGDPHHSQTIFDLLPKKYASEKLICVGRLDKESQGLLILTNDGDLAQKIAHPSGQVTKRYEVRVDKPFNEEKIPVLLRGVRSEGEHLCAKEVIPAKRGPDKECCLEVHLTQGRKREIRRLLEAVGYRVKRLKRVQIGGYALKKQPVGSVRVLKEQEIALLF